MLNPEELFEELEKRGLDWAEEDAALKALEDTKHSILSKAMADLNSRESVAAQKVKAERSNKYTIHLRLIENARYKANRSKIMWVSYQAYLDLVRSKSAARNSEMNLR